jgi:Rrf2 family protein
MLLTTKGRYAVIAMLDLMLNLKEESSPTDQTNPKNTVRVSDIAARQKLAVTYLEQIFSKLRQGGIVESVKGPGGGYKLARPANKITTLDIIKAVGEEIKMTRCSECKTTSCIPEGETKCATHDLWKGLSNHINQYFADVTLDKLRPQNNA